jgi:hypothetical protein
MITSALVAIISSTSYRYCVFVFTQITFVKMLTLALLLVLCVGAIFTVLRILLNLSNDVKGRLPSLAAIGSDQSIRQRPPATGTQNNRFGAVSRAW